MRLTGFALWFAVSAAASEWHQTPAFDHFYNLDHDRAVQLLEADLVRDPRDARLHNHLAYALLNRAMLRSGALDSALASSSSSFFRRPRVEMPAAEQERFGKLIDQSLELSQERLRRHPRDAEALYSLGVAHVHRTNFQLFVQRSWRQALQAGTEARRAHQAALEINPALVDAQLVPAMHDYVVGSLPAFLRIVGFLAGKRGDKVAGLRGIEHVAQRGQRTAVEANILLAVVYSRQNQAERALAILDRLCRQFPRNYVYQMERIHALAQNRQWTEARRDADALPKGYPHLPPDRYQRFRAVLAERVPRQ